MAGLTELESLYGAKAIQREGKEKREKWTREPACPGHPTGGMVGFGLSWSPREKDSMKPVCFPERFPAGAQECSKDNAQTWFPKGMIKYSWGTLCPQLRRN